MTENRSALRLLHKPVVFIPLVLLVGIVLGRGLGGSGTQPSAGNQVDHQHTAIEEETVWTCSMHPQIQLPASGQCPICFMDLIPLKKGSGSDGTVPRLEMSEAARVLAEIETVPVVRETPLVEVRLAGKVDYDETRIGSITARVAGRLDRLYVDYTGISVRKRDHLAEIYSPELLSAKGEFLQALRSRETSQESASRIMQGAAEATVEASREKLRLLGLTARQIDRLAEEKKASDHVTLFAPIGGVVIEKNAVEGDYVKTGTAIYRIADLSQLWVKLDAYESDLATLRYGQRVEFTTEAVPGEVFEGEIVFIAPTLDPRTRTSKVRVHVDNKRGLLKPEMFVRATVLAEVDTDGAVVARDLAGKRICPMHPEIVRDRRGACDVCGMPLERAEELGYVSADPDGAGALVIPRTAVLFTGKRAIVYVEDPEAEAPTYEGREVVLGPRAGEVYVVKEGLTEGERVVVRGNFKIDSALQILAKPSMMSPRDEARAGAAAAGGRIVESQGFLASLSPVFDAYFSVASALAGDDPDAARRGIGAVQRTVRGIEGKTLSPPGRKEWKRLSKELGAALAGPAADADLASLRASFEGLSKSILAIERVFGHAGDAEFYLTYCPMAFDFRGAHWMQNHEQIDNPYFGSKMLRCGEVQEELPPVGGES